MLFSLCPLALESLHPQSTSGRSDEHACMEQLIIHAHNRLHATGLDWTGSFFQEFLFIGNCTFLL